MVQDVDLSNKYLITAGCSFVESCENYKTWASWLAEKTLPKKHYNESTGAAGNALIMRRVMYRVEQLLNSGVLSDDIVILISWTATSRHELYIDRDLAKKYIIPNNKEKKLTHTYYMDNKYPIWLYGAWVIGSEDVMFHTFRNTEISTIQTLEYILMLQMYFKQHNIKYKMMTYMDIFSRGYADMSTRMLHWEDVLYKDSIPEAISIWNMIDFDRFLFIDSPSTKYGGLMEYAIDRNLGFWKDIPDMHPHEDAHILFVDDVLIPLLKSML